eukprot:COSAG06_NODE_8030_length_2293_cov_24.732908_2_plen_73_part_00
MRLIWRDCCSFNSIELSDIVLIALRTPGRLNLRLSSHTVVGPDNVFFGVKVRVCLFTNFAKERSRLAKNFLV